MNPTTNKSSTHKIEKLCTVLGISITSLLFPSSTTAAADIPTGSQAELIAQASKRPSTPSKREIKEIQSAINKAIKTGDINGALKGVKLNKMQTNALQKLTRSDLKTLGRIKQKLNPVDTSGVWGVGIF